MNAILRLLLLALAAGAALLLAAGCDSNAEDDEPVRLRVVHAAADAGRLDFNIDFDLFARDLAFREASPYIEWEPGIRLLEITFVDDAGLTNSISREVLLEPGLAYTILLTGTDASGAIVLVVDDRRLPPLGEAQLRAVHAARRANAVDGSVQPQAGGAAILSATGLPFGVDTDPVTAAAGVYDFTFSSPQGAATLTGRTLEEGRRYLAVITHAGSTAALALFLVEDG